MIHAYFNYLKKFKPFSVVSILLCILYWAIKFSVNLAMWQENMGAGENEKRRMKTDVLSILYEICMISNMQLHFEIYNNTESSTSI